MKVLITRAIGPAKNTAMNLSAAGHEAVILPLVEYYDLPADKKDVGILSRQFDGVAFTSSAAVGALERRVGDQILLQALHVLPVYCVGRKTADAARNAGFYNIHVADGDVGSLAALITSELQAKAGSNKQFLYPAPLHKHENLADLLCEHKIEELTVYEARLVDPGKQNMERAMDAVARGAVFFYSRRTAAHFFKMITMHGLQEKLEPEKIVAISTGVAQSVRQLSQINDDHLVEAANSPNEDAMISCLSAFK